ncbi:MAG: hypothetical protein QM784_10135 [Polyangiaceae bacterium]
MPAPMNAQFDTRPFGTAATCASARVAVQLVRNSPSNPRLRLQSAAFALALTAVHAQGPTTYFEDSRRVVDELARAKAEVDIAAWHDMKVVELTEAIVLRAQRYLDEMTIPCTEWPLPSEIVAVVIEEAQTRARI